MSHTNSTSNYSLPQFVGTDKPAWLTDVNGAMSAIDTQMKANADAATTAGADATSAKTSIGTLANLTTTIKTDLVSAVNEVDSDLATVSGVASGASTTATNANNSVAALARYFTLTQTGQITPTISGGTIGTPNNLYYALNADGTYGKIYGRIRVSVTNANGATITLPISALNASSDFTIASAGSYAAFGTGERFLGIFNGVDLNINHTAKTATITLSSGTYNSTCTIILSPAGYYFTDFGDEPED